MSQEDNTLEHQMREEEVPWLKTSEELTAYIASQLNREHTYGSVVYAMRNAALAAFNHIATNQGVTGFQASCADMSFLTKSRGIKGPWMLIKLEDCLYPQYDVPGKVTEFLESADSVEWLRAEAQKRLDELTPDSYVSPRVVEHWEQLAAHPKKED